MNAFLNQTILRNRTTLLISILLSYVLIIVIEGEVTGREARPYVIENPYADLQINRPEPADSGEEPVSIRRLFWGR